MKTRIFYLITILIIVSVFISNCGENEDEESDFATATLTGMVTSEVTGEPLEGVSIALEGNQLETTTDAQGRWTLEDVPAGIQIAVISKEGYATKQLELDVPGDMTMLADCALGESDDVKAIKAVLKLYDKAREDGDFEMIASLLSPNYDDGKFDKQGVLDNLENNYKTLDYISYATMPAEIRIQGNTATVGGMRELIFLYYNLGTPSKYTQRNHATVLLERNSNGTWLITNTNKTPRGGKVWMDEYLLAGELPFDVFATTWDDDWNYNTQSATFTDWMGNRFPMKMKKKLAEFFLKEGMAGIFLQTPHASGVYEFSVSLVSTDGDTYTIQHAFEVR